MNNCDRKEELKLLVKSFFDDYLDYTEIHGQDEHVVHPITISCCRALKSEPLCELLAKMKELSK